MELKNKYLKQYAVVISPFFIVCLLVSAGFLSGCVSMGKKTDTLAYVDGDPITRDDLAYALSVEHRREDLSTGKSLNMKDYLDKLISDRLIVQEARRIGIQEYPAVKEKIQAYIIRESVLILHEEEILNKVSFNEDDIKKYYKDNYKVFKLDVFGFDANEDALKFKDMILQGLDISQVKKGDAGINRIDEGKEFTYMSLAPSMQKAVSELAPGVYTDIVEVKGAYYILKIISFAEASDDKFESARAQITNRLENLKEEERSSQYLKELRDQASLNIENEILSSLKLGAEDGDRAKLANDSRILVTVNGEVLTVGKFVELLPPVIKISNEQLFDSWLYRKLVDQEALRRRYDLQPKLGEMVKQYENQLLQNMYINEVVMPNIEVSEEILNAYFDNHKENYLTPARYKLQVITVDEMDGALEIHNILLKGADFSWLARMRSKDGESAEKGGSIGWRDKKQLPLPLKDIIDTLKPGDITPVLKVDSRYSVFLVQDISEPQIKAFSAVKQDVYNAYMAEQYRKVHDRNIEELRADTEIIINEDAVEAFQKLFK